MAVYHYHALAIQGAFRGYQSRKYNYNHARRKGYLQEVRMMQLISQVPQTTRLNLQEHVTHKVLRAALTMVEIETFFRSLCAKIIRYESSLNKIFVVAV